MFLQKVEIVGFKSFATQSVVDFAPAARVVDGREHCGVTAIVGPNGSGKSNVADAIRWVMGEQSMKGLRAKKADDVIFAGSSTRARINTASVSLFFDNAQNVGNISADVVDGAQVVVTRTVFRDGAGEYRINDRKVRLSDVVDLLAHAGLGKGSYSVVTQGMTDGMLAATPLERRAIIEDAAGVKPHQIKKQRALRKLDTTHGNVLRVSELIAEIEPHLAMLKRQANRAAKAADIAAELKEKQQLLYGWRWYKFQLEQSSALEELGRHKSKLEAMEAGLKQARAQIAAESQKLQKSATDGDVQLLASKRKLAAKLSEAQKDAAVLDGRVTIEQERMARDLAAIKTHIPVDTIYVQEHLDTLAADMERAIAANDTEKLAQIMRKLRTEVVRLREDVVRGTVEIDTTNERNIITTAAEKAISKAMEKRVQAKKTIGSLQNEIGAINHQLEQGRRTEQQQRVAFFAKERELRDQEQKLTNLRNLLSTAKIRLARVEVRSEDLTSLIGAELRCAPAEIPFNPQSDVVEDDDALAQIVGRLKSRHEAAGAVDPLVIEEYEQTQERYDFLTAELADLQGAMADLVAVVTEMDKKIDSAFADAYTKISTEFSNYFRMMFGGGEAILSKVNVPVRMREVNGGGENEGGNSSENNFAQNETGVGADDMSDVNPEDETKKEQTQSGIAISASPPGKKVHNLAMLSGGERSLVSLAFLFAIISYNPPPFIVLDEVEAALDETNARRFGTILDDLAHRTQFVVITHNRETMRHATLMYGVTMNNDGISRLLSVQLDAAEKLVDEESD